MAGGDSGVSGTLTLVQQMPDGPVSIQGTVSGLSPGRHGFHVHTNGDLRDNCVAAGGHFNPAEVRNGISLALKSLHGKQ